MSDNRPDDCAPRPLVGGRLLAEITNRIRSADRSALALRALLTVAVGCWWGNPTQDTRDTVVATAESLDVAGWLRRDTGALLIDGIGTWLAGIMDEAALWRDRADSPASPDPAQQVRSRIDDLIGAWRQTSALVVAVTDEVGSGLVPPYPAGRVFRDQLGWLNQQLAAESELTVHVVAGRAVPLGGCGQ